MAVALVARMVKTWVIATSVIAIGAITLFRRWRRREHDTQALSSSLHGVSSEWLANARAQHEDTW